VLVDLSAAYDTVWHRGLTLKLLKTIPSKQMVGFIMDMIRNHHFTVPIGSKKSRYRILKNDVPQGLVLAPALFNVYTYDLATTVCRKYVYTDDLALANSGTD